MGSIVQNMGGIFMAAELSTSGTFVLKMKPTKEEQKIRQ